MSYASVWSPPDRFQEFQAVKSQRTPVKHFRYLRRFVQGRFVSGLRGRVHPIAMDKVTNVGDAVVDPLAVYVPFTSDYAHFGIYYRVRNIFDDFVGFSLACVKAFNRVPDAYVYMLVIRLHELMHHMCEKIAYLNAMFAANPNVQRRVPKLVYFATRVTILERYLTSGVGTQLINSYKNYYLTTWRGVYSGDEEGLCEYEAFTSVFNNFTHNMARHMLSSVAKKIAEYLMQAVKDIAPTVAGVLSAKETVAALYYWWNRDSQQPPYTTRVTHNIAAETGFPTVPNYMLLSYLAGGSVLKVPEYLTTY